MNSEPEKADILARCLNCKASMGREDQYCAACGQKACDPQPTLATLLADFFAQQFALEGRLFRTVVTLLFYPGRLTLDYWHGRRARYFSPIQTYLVSSLLFFLMLDTVSIMTDTSPVQIQMPDFKREIAQMKREQVDLIVGFRRITVTREQLVEFVEWESDRLEEFFAKHRISVGPFGWAIARIAHEVMQPGGAQKLAMEWLRVFSQSVIFLMPVFGGILYGLYWRRSETAVKCIVLSAHVHSFVFITMILLSGLLAFGMPTFFARWYWLVVMVYFGLAQYFVFGGHMAAIAIKSLVATFVYLMGLALFVFALLPIVYFKI